MAVGWVALVAAVCFLHILAFVLAVGAERRRSTGRVVPDMYDEYTYCSYNSDASTAYGLAAFGLLLLSQTLLSTVTKCFCFRSRHPAAAANPGGGRSSAICCVVFFWLSFLVAEACLIAGSARNAYHTKYVGQYFKKDLDSCATLRKGVFAAAAAMILVSMMASLLYYWVYAKATPGGWQRYTNEEGIGMTSKQPVHP